MHDLCSILLHVLHKFDIRSRPGKLGVHGLTNIPDYAGRIKHEV